MTVCGRLLVVCGNLLVFCGRLLVVCSRFLVVWGSLAGGLWSFVVVCGGLCFLPVLVTTYLSQVFLLATPL